MKKLVILLLSLTLVWNLTACGNSRQAETLPAVEAEENDRQDTVPETEDNLENTSGGRILIAYFAVADNSDVDAISSASVTVVNGEAKGLVQTVAEDIQAVTGGDLFSIETSVDYPGDINDLIEYASVEQDNDERPELTTHIKNLDQYDTIFVGYPLWLAYHDLIQCTQA